MQTVPAAALADRVLGIVKPLGRIRANALEVFAADGRLLYRSPPPTYKGWTFCAGLVHWFAGPDISTAHPSGQ
jgi:two-component system sensor histidine kinase UhpB